MLGSFVGRPAITMPCPLVSRLRFFGVMIIPVGIVSIVLVMLQPIAAGAWCFWCLLTAAATLVMIPLAVDEASP
jgi:hypothetical protein